VSFEQAGKLEHPLSTPSWPPPRPSLAKLEKKLHSYVPDKTPLKINGTKSIDLFICELLNPLLFEQK
jgi:hypothetical protein